MKTLVIIRHGKSSWENPSLIDLKRPLLQKGINRTKKVGNYLKKIGLLADIFISSPAERAKQTAKLIAEILGYKLTEIMIEDAFYFSGVTAIRNKIFTFNNKWDTAFIFGHNPDFTSLSSDYISSRNYFYLPTTGTVILKFKAEKWEEISEENCFENKIIFPRVL